MNIKKLNEEIEKFLEISDQTKQSYLAKRQDQIDLAQKRLEKAQTKMDRAKRMVVKSNKRQLSNLPDSTDLETAENALYALKAEMRKVSSGSSWELEREEGSNYISLQVRYWGTWDDREEDDDWAPLSDKYRKILDDILYKIQKQYNVKIIEPGSEKKWLVFDIYLQDDPSEEITISDINKVIKEYDYDILEIENPEELFYSVFGCFNFKSSYDNFEVAYSPNDDFGMTLYPDGDKEAPIFCLTWTNKGKLFIYQQWYKHTDEWLLFVSYNYLKQKGLILAELDSKLFMPRTKQDLVKFIKIAKEECERILTDFDNNIIKNIHYN